VPAVFDPHHPGYHHPAIIGFSVQRIVFACNDSACCASPCALALAHQPQSLPEWRKPPERGVVKGGAHLENLGRIKAIAFDKTGTLTHGTPEVTDIVMLHESRWEQQRCCRLRQPWGSRSAHPLSQAIVRAAQPQNAPALLLRRLSR